jgi:Lipocalin-like domain
VKFSTFALVAVPVVLRLSVVPSFAQQHTPTTAELQGTWKLVSLTFDGQPQKASGYMIFQGGSYSFITSRERPRIPAGAGEKPPAQLTPEEVGAYVEAFRNMTAAAGPFSIKGDEILYVMEVVRTPNLAGQTEERKSWLENGKLMQDFMGGGRRQVYVWERAPSGSR